MRLLLTLVLMIPHGLAPSAYASTLGDARGSGDSTSVEVSASQISVMQHDPEIPETNAVIEPRFYFITGTLLAGMVGIRVYQANGWWVQNRRPFHFQEDIDYALQVDKIAHFWSSALMSQILTTAYEWSGLRKESALWWGATGAALFTTYVEVEDGFSTWGFDRIDFAGNVLGAFWPVMRYHAPFLKTIDLKWWYTPSQNLHARGAFPGQQHLVFDDYEGYSFWLSAKVNNFVPRNLDWIWPDFLCIALGYRAREILDPTKRYTEFLIGFDFDMTKIIPDDTAFLRSLGETLNYFRFPAPAVKITGGVVWYGLYY